MIEREIGRKRGKERVKRSEGEGRETKNSRNKKRITSKLLLLCISKIEGKREIDRKIERDRDIQ